MRILKLVFYGCFLGFVSNVNAQTSSLNGKIFRVKLNETCKLMPGGGCTVLTFLEFEFKSDSVTIKNEVKALCSDTTNEAKYTKNTFQSFAYQLVNNQVKIPAYKDYSELEFANSSLILKTTEGPIQIPMQESKAE